MDAKKVDYNRLKLLELWDLRDGQPADDFKGLKFRYTATDKVGTNGNIWGYIGRMKDTPTLEIEPQYAPVFGAPPDERPALLKSPDYEYTDVSINEWLYSRIARKILTEVKIPSIQRVKYKNEKCLLSYSLLNNPMYQELFHMEDILSLKFGSISEQEHYKCFGLKDIFECIDKFVSDPKNAETIKKGTVLTTALDAASNNVDRHGKNWGIIRNIKTGACDLFAIDHSLAFINLIDPRPGAVNSHGYTTSIVGSKSSMDNYENGEKTLIYIQKEFPEYFEELGKRIEVNLEEIKELCENAEKELGYMYRKNTLKDFIKRFYKIMELRYEERGVMDRE